MDKIVFQYDQGAKEKVSGLKSILYVLFVLIMLILIVEFFILFRPSAYSVKKVISKLLFSQQKSINMAQKAEKIHLN